MKGAIFKGIQDLVLTAFGTAAWREIVEKAVCGEVFFVAGEDYPDALAISLVKAAAEVADMTEEEVMIEFGKFWIQNTAQTAYPTLFGLAGNSSREFLLNLNRIHELVTRNLMGAHPPQFEFENVVEGKLLIHYGSPRRLCAVLRGLILGVGIHFEESLTVDEITCMHKGRDRCTMEVTFP